MRVLMTGGGTGGHVNPAIAIADTIRKNLPGSEIAFVGTEKGLESRLVPESNYPITFIKSRGFNRKHLISRQNFEAAYYAVTSPLKAKEIIRSFRPDIVIGTGGYVSWPLLVAASRCGVPTIVHESNAYAGLTVRKLQPYVDEILVNFDSTKEQLTSARGEVLRVGNPLRGDFGRYSKEEARRILGIGKDEKFVLSYGGSLGAEQVNLAVLALLGQYGKTAAGYRHLHATGKYEYEEGMRLCRAYGLLENKSITVVEYIYDMPLQMAAADLIIARAGAMTVTELSMMGKAAILIPSPNVTDNHQYKNAKALADKGAAVLLPESELSPERLICEVRSILEHDEKREALEKHIRSFSEPDAGKLIFREVLRLTEPHRESAGRTEHQAALGQVL